MAANEGKIKIRRGTTSDWSSAGESLVAGQPGVEYATDTMNGNTVNLTHLKVGGKATTTAWGSLKYVTPPFYTYTDEGSNSSKYAQVTHTPVGSGSTPPATLRNIVVSDDSTPSASAYPEGTVLLII